MRVWVPMDAAARAVGADEVAEAVQREMGVAPTRNGSRGMIWLEPLMEIEIDGVRHGFGPVAPADVPVSLADPAGHPLALGPVEELPWMKRQTRLTFARVGVIDPLSLEEYKAHGGLEGLKAALAAPEKIVPEVTESGLRGRGGAGLPAGNHGAAGAKGAADRQ